MFYWYKNIHHEYVHNETDIVFIRDLEHKFTHIMQNSYKCSVYKLIRYIGTTITIEFIKSNNNYVMTFKQNNVKYAEFIFPMTFNDKMKYSILDVYNMKDLSIMRNILCKHEPCMRRDCSFICNIDSVMVEKDKLAGTHKFAVLDRLLGVDGYTDTIRGSHILCLIKKIALCMLRCKQTSIEFTLDLPTYDIDKTKLFIDITDTKTNLYHLSVLAGILLYDQDISKYIHGKLTNAFYIDYNPLIHKVDTIDNSDKVCEQLLEQIDNMSPNTKDMCIKIIIDYIDKKHIELTTDMERMIYIIVTNLDTKLLYIMLDKLLPKTV